jgi:hypothetical protein
MKFIRLFLLSLGVVLMARAEIPVEVRTTGFGVVVLAEPVPRAALDKVFAEAPAAPDAPPPALWLRWADGSVAALDMEVTRLLPDGLLKVYTMSSTSPLLAPGERDGAATVMVRAAAPFEAEDWTLQPGEAEEKAGLVAAFHTRYGTGKRREDLSYYDKPVIVTDKQRNQAEKRAAQLDAEAKPAPSLRAAKAADVAALNVPVTLVRAGERPSVESLVAAKEDLQTLPKATQVPLGNYNYDHATIEALDKPNELTVADAQGVDLFALAQRRFGVRAVAAVELMCYNGFTSTITAPKQGLLLTPANGDVAAALAAGEMIYVSHEDPVVIKFRRTGQSPAESASGVLLITVLLNKLKTVPQAL